MASAVESKSMELFAGAEHDLEEIQQRDMFAKHVLRRLDSLCIDKFERQVKEQPKKPFVIFDGFVYTYEAMDTIACKVANIGKSWGLKPLDCVAILIQNEPCFVWTYLGLLKLGVSVAFINYNLRSHSLAHCVNAVDCKALIVGPGSDLLEAVTNVLPQLNGLSVYAQGTNQQQLPAGISSFDVLMQKTFPLAIAPEIRSGLTFDDTCCYIFTSGTTGKPKPVIYSHAKAVALCCMCEFFASMTPQDVIYNVLPLYHNTGIHVAIGAPMFSGATVVLRKKFSARHFWSDCRQYKVTVLPYIGELLRYLVAQPKTELDGVHNIRVAFGAGLRADVWNIVLERFKIKRILEYYGATEGYASTANFSCKPGAIGRLSPLLKRFDPDHKVLVKFDVADVLPIRDKNGRCIPVKIGEPGLFLSKVPEQHLNKKLYKASAEANEKKFVRDVFAPGDIYMNYGDTLVQDKEYFLYFYDRLGDTFRWKGENVSTKEVANTIGTLPFIEDANVYGVEIPGHEGKAGMASISLAHGAQLGRTELNRLYDQICKELPVYARPLFLRHIPEAVITGTFKNKKVELAQEGYDLNVVKDPLYFLDSENNTYTPLGKDSYAKLIKSRL